MPGIDSESWMPLLKRHNWGQRSGKRVMGKATTLVVEPLPGAVAIKVVKIHAALGEKDQASHMHSLRHRHYIIINCGADSVAQNS